MLETPQLQSRLRASGWKVQNRRCFLCLGILSLLFLELEVLRQRMEVPILFLRTVFVSPVVFSDYFCFWARTMSCAAAYNYFLVRFRKLFISGRFDSVLNSGRSSYLSWKLRKGYCRDKIDKDSVAQHIPSQSAFKLPRSFSMSWPLRMGARSYEITRSTTPNGLLGMCEYALHAYEIPMS